MDMTIRAMKPMERMYSYTQSTQIMAQTGCIGHLRADMDTDGNGFFSSWNDHRGDLKTQEFKERVAASIAKALPKKNPSDVGRICGALLLSIKTSKQALRRFWTSSLDIVIGLQSSSPPAQLSTIHL